MDAYTETMERLIEALGRLPGIGRRSAERIAFHLLEGDEEEVKALAEAVHDIKTKVGHCAECGALADKDRCAICSSARRNRSRICVVEKPKDVIRIEATGGYDGLYHVLGGLLAPTEGRGPDRLDVEHLAKRVAGGEVEEIILALAATAEGDGTALYVADRLRETGVKVTRLARGLPAGASLDYANQGMLADALRDRREMES